MGQGRIGSRQSGVLGSKSCNVRMPVFGQIQVVCWFGGKVQSFGQKGRVVLG